MKTMMALLAAVMALAGPSVAQERVQTKPHFTVMRFKDDPAPPWVGWMYQIRRAGPWDAPHACVVLVERKIDGNWVGSRPIQSCFLVHGDFYPAYPVVPSIVVPDVLPFTMVRLQVSHRVVCYMFNELSDFNKLDCFATNGG